ncbi:hypothetical protein [Enterococcus sp. RTP21361st1_A6_RTP21361_211029]|uniref:hypothetical protein n=1 Tax=Enterococcus sp. RTP21361st1_A6_RTP21361_211029 TaxID=3143199 RepID=UPI0034A48D34
MPRQPFGTLADMAHPHLRAHRTARGPQATHAPDNRRLPRMQTRDTGREGRIAAAVQMRQPHQRGGAARAEPSQGRGDAPDQDPCGHEPVAQGQLRVRGQPQSNHHVDTPGQTPQQQANRRRILRIQHQGDSQHGNGIFQPAVGCCHPVVYSVSG